MHGVSILGILTHRKQHHSHHQCEGGHASRHQQHRSHHQCEWAHTSSHCSHHQRDRGPTQRCKHSKHRHRLIQSHFYSQPSHRSRSPHSPQLTRRTRHAHYSPSSPDSSRDSSSSSLLLDSSNTNSDTYSSSEQHHHSYRVKHHRNHRRHCYRHRHSSEDSWVADTVVSCAPPISRHLCCNLNQGKYVNFASLLLPLDLPPLVPGKRQRKEKSSHSIHSIMDQQIWLEAWNPFQDSGQQLAGDRPPLTSRLGPSPRHTAFNNVTQAHPAPKFARGTSVLYPTAGTPIRAGRLAATGHTWTKGV